MNSPHTKPSPIGVFDSGIGGLSVLRALVQELPHERFIYLADSGYAPYGERGDVYVVQRSRACAQWLIDQGCQMIVVACNTATAAAIDTLRAEFAQVQWVGIEPALKPAVAATKTGHIAVFATRGTLQSDKFAALVAAQPAHIRISPVPCDGLAEAIEHADETEIATKIIAACAVFTPANGQFDHQNANAAVPDVAVMGCTHYPLAERVWRIFLPAGVQWIDPAQAVARRSAHLHRGQQASPGQGLHLSLATTGEAQSLQTAVAAHLHSSLAAAVRAVDIPNKAPNLP
jgi:glutamate racemase